MRSTCLSYNYKESEGEGAIEEKRTRCKSVELISLSVPVNLITVPKR